MPRFAANLTMMFNEWSFLDRFDAAAEAGFTAVEFLFPYEHPAEAIAERLIRNRLTPALFNMPPGDWAKGDKGMASFPERRAEFEEGVATALRYADATGTKTLHMMAGLRPRDNLEAADAYRSALAYAAGRLAEKGLTLVIEPINGRDMPGYFLSDFDQAAGFVRDLGMPNLKLQFDLYHRQIVHGDVTMALRATMPIVGHVQIASVPSRNEPDGEELNYPFCFAELDRLGYLGFVGCEYRPRGKTTDGLGWFKPYAGARS